MPHYNRRVSAAPDLDAAVCRNLGPERILTEASSSVDRFLSRYGDTQLLLIKLALGLDIKILGKRELLVAEVVQRGS